VSPLDAILRSLPAQTVQATMRNPRGQADRVFSGPSLVDFAVSTGIVTEPVLRASSAAGYFVVTAEDGACVTVSGVEALDARDGDRCIILATTQDGEPLGVGVRLIVPEYPGLAGRSLMRVAEVAYEQIAAVDPPPPLPDGQVVLDGLLDRPGPLNLAELETAQVTELVTPTMVGHGRETVPPRRYAGILLYRLLEMAGIRLNPDNHEDFLRKVVVATSADGQSVVVAGGEIEPRFRAGQVLLATHRDGAPLDEREGPVRLVIPYGRQPGRWIRDVVAVTLREG